MATYSSSPMVAASSASPQSLTRSGAPSWPLGMEAPSSLVAGAGRCLVEGAGWYLVAMGWYLEAATSCLEGVLYLEEAAS